MEFIPDNDRPRPDSWRIEDLIVSEEFGSKRVWRGEVVIGWTVPLTGANPRGKEESLLKSLQIRGDESVIPAGPQGARESQQTLIVRSLTRKSQSPRQSRDDNLCLNCRNPTPRIWWSCRRTTQKCRSLKLKTSHMLYFTLEIKILNIPPRISEHNGVGKVAITQAESLLINTICSEGSFRRLIEAIKVSCAQ